MKAIVVYSSKTGRIQQIAQAMAQVLPQGTPCVPVDEMPSDFSNYDCVFMGFWIDENQADPKGQEALKKIANDMLAEFLDTSDEWITTRTGIKSRHVISDENIEDLGAEASRKALDMAGLKPQDIDFFICSNAPGI